VAQGLTFPSAAIRLSVQHAVLADLVGLAYRDVSVFRRAASNLIAAPKLAAVGQPFRQCLWPYEREASGGRSKGLSPRDNSAHSYEPCLDGLFAPDSTRVSAPPAHPPPWA